MLPGNSSNITMNNIYHPLFFLETVQEKENHYLNVVQVDSVVETRW